MFTNSPLLLGLAIAVFLIFLVGIFIICEIKERSWKGKGDIKRDKEVNNGKKAK